MSRYVNRSVTRVMRLSVDRLLLGLLCALALLCLAACSTAGPRGPDSPSAPAAWIAAPAVGPGQLRPWWRNFADPTLDDLIERALQRNGDLTMAGIRLQRADLQALLIGTKRQPAWAADASASAARSAGTARTVPTLALSGALAFEVDLWGRLKLQRDQAGWERAATVDDCHATALMLEGNVAAVYWELAYLNRLLANADAGIAYSLRTVDIVRARHEAGAVSGGDLAQAEQVLASRRASRTGLEQRRQELRHGMAVMFDQPPGTPLEERGDLPARLIPAVDAGLPSGLLARRPDLRAAELRLRSTLTQRDVTRLSFYPAFSLTGNLGVASEQLVDLLARPAGLLVANLALPLVQGDVPRLSEAIADTQYQEALVAFRRQWLGALAEVEDRLSARGNLLSEAGHLERALDQAQLAERHAETRYRAGATAAQSWLDSQQTLRNIEDQLAANRFNQLVNMVRLYQALGGEEDPARLRCSVGRGKPPGET